MSDAVQAGNEQAEAAGLTLEPSDDVREMRDWVHEFAKNVMRPAAAEWDEREETPWPILEEASKIGLYSLDFFGGQWFEPTGLGTPVAFEEIFWGDAGIGLALTGTCLAAVAVSSSGTPEQIGEWLPQMFGGLRATSSSAPSARPSPTRAATSARSGPELSTREATDEWVLNGTKAWATNGGIADVHVVVASVDPALGSRGQASFIVPPGTPGLSQGQKFRKHGVRASHTAEVVLDNVRVPGRCLVGGKERLDARLARLAAGQAGGEQAAMKTFEASRPTVAAMAVGVARAAFEYARDYAVEPGPIRQADRPEPGDRLHAGRHGGLGRRGQAPDLAGGRDGQARAQVHQGRGLDVEAGRGGDRGARDRAGDPDSRRQRIHQGVPGRTHAQGREDLHDLRGHVGDPAHDHRQGRHRA